MVEIEVALAMDVINTIVNGGITCNDNWYNKF